MSAGKLVFGVVVASITWPLSATAERSEAYSGWIEGPGFRVERKIEYFPDRRTFEREVEDRTKELESQGAGGSAWFNRREQAREETATTTRREIRGEAGPFGAGFSFPPEDVRRSVTADEEALKKATEKKATEGRK